MVALIPMVKTPWNGFRILWSKIHSSTASGRMESRSTKLTVFSSLARGRNTGTSSVETAMPGYLYPEVNQRKTYPAQSLIFPFGGNASQFQAVENALNHQRSVIQGPPGTKQAQRDRLKDSIFEKYGIPLLRLPTNGSGEIEKVRTYLERAK